MSVSDEGDPMLEPPQESEEELEGLQAPIQVTETADSTQSVQPQQSFKGLKRPLDNDQCKDEDEGETCPICLEMWADAGEHRLCAMKCGHLFGRSCIEMWLGVNRNCPTCKKRGLKRDLRNLYCSKVIALEESSVLDLKARLHQSELTQSILQTTVNQYAVQRERLSAQVTSLQEHLQAAQAQLLNTTTAQHASQAVGVYEINADVYRRLVWSRSVHISAEIGCRVMDHDPWLNAIVCSMKCSNAMFGSYGLAKLNMATFEMIGNMPLHSAPIRDVRFQSAGGSSLLVTASMDKQARLVDTRAPGTARTYGPAANARGAPLWACCWGDPGAVGGSYALFVGEQQGDVIELDVRRLSERVSTLKVEGDMSPVVSLQALPASAGDCLAGGALVACRLNSVRVFERVQGVYKLRTLCGAPQGPFMSMAVDRAAMTGAIGGAGGNSRHLLLSSRPNSAFAWTRHMYGQFREDGDSLTFQPIHTFAGGSAASLLSRGCLTAQRACAYMETSSSLAAWSLTTGQILVTRPVQKPILDVAVIAANDRLMALDERKLEIFQME